MASVKNNPLLQGVRGKIGDSIVVKQYSYGTVISVLPDMSRVKPSIFQRAERKRFAAAVAYASHIARNPMLRAEWTARIPEGTSVYYTALRQFLAEHPKGMFIEDP